ncbi:replication initiation factor domain-containing protein [Niallia taxi]|nr:replication initiation factor domain-containing protein [Niallia taxi]MDE5051753.1 replication initiation factor domain-containing protein [Niallia taxi]
MSEAFVTPPTNRGVKNEEEKLTACIDWMQITLRGVTPQLICEDILGIPYELMRNDLRGGIKGGYRSLLCFDDIRVLEPSGKNLENGYQVLMAGKGCRNFEMFLDAQGIDWFDFIERVMQFDYNFPRIDLAIDDRKTYFKISTLIKMAEKGLCISRMRVGKKHGTFKLLDGSTGGETVDFGSRQSQLFMTFYEKNYEQAAKLGLVKDEMEKKWNRYELKFRQERAVKLANEMMKRREVFSVAMEVMNNSMRFVVESENNKDPHYWPLWKPWEWFMRDIKKLKLYMQPSPKTFDEFISWLTVYISPSLKILEVVDNRLGTTYLTDLLAQAKLDKKHYAMIESFIGQNEMLLEQRKANTGDGG